MMKAKSAKTQIEREKFNSNLQLMEKAKTQKR